MTDTGSAHLGLIKCSEFKKKKIKLPVPRVADTEAPPLRTNYTGDREEPRASSHKAMVSTRVVPIDIFCVVHARRVPCGSSEGPHALLCPPRSSPPPAPADRPHPSAAERPGSGSIADPGHQARLSVCWPHPGEEPCRSLLPPTPTWGQVLGDAKSTLMAE